MSLRTAAVAISFTLLSCATVPSTGPGTTVRTEGYPRAPYSGATYYIYERSGEVVCTKLEVCNKFGQCDVSYHKGAFKDEWDIKTGEPYDATPAEQIPQAKLGTHQCLVRHQLTGS